MPRLDAEHDSRTSQEDFDQRVRLQWEALEQPNATEITRQLFDGQDGGRNWVRVRESLERQRLI
jgi:hypothetical protein